MVHHHNRKTGLSKPYMLHYNPLRCTWIFSVSSKRLDSFAYHHITNRRWYHVNYSRWYNVKPTLMLYEVPVQGINHSNIFVNICCPLFRLLRDNVSYFAGKCSCYTVYDSAAFLWLISISVWQIIKINPKMYGKVSLYRWIITYLEMFYSLNTVRDSKVHGANMGPTWVLSAPDGPHVGPMNLAIRDAACDFWYIHCHHGNREWSWCELCRHWWQRRLPLQPLVPQFTTKLA